MSAHSLSKLTITASIRGSHRTSRDPHTYKRDLSAQFPFYLILLYDLMG